MKNKIALLLIFTVSICGMTFDSFGKWKIQNSAYHGIGDRNGDWEQVSDYGTWYQEQCQPPGYTCWKWDYKTTWDEAIGDPTPNDPYCSGCGICSGNTAVADPVTGHYKPL